jgi:hypothetical protein
MSANTCIGAKPSAAGGATEDAREKLGKPVRRPLLIVDNSDLPAVAGMLSIRFAASDKLFERGELRPGHTHDCDHHDHCERLVMVVTVWWPNIFATVRRPCPQ